MYVVITPAETVTFQYDYRVNGRRETLTIGLYGRDGISLAIAPERLTDARCAVDEGRYRVGINIAKADAAHLYRRSGASRTAHQSGGAFDQRRAGAVKFSAAARSRHLNAC